MSSTRRAGAEKIPVMPNYLISWSTKKVVLRNYEGVITTYREPDHYEEPDCEYKCEECGIQSEAEDWNKEICISSLLSDSDEGISLIPADNERFQRREEYDQRDDNEYENNMKRDDNE